MRNYKLSCTYNYTAINEMLELLNQIFYAQPLSSKLHYKL